MKSALSWLNKKIIKIKRYFDSDQKTEEKKAFGLGHFVLLLSLAPFIFNLSLYDIGSKKNIASKYQFNPNRFDGQTFHELIAFDSKKPKMAILKDKSIYKIIKNNHQETYCIKRIKQPVTPSNFFISKELTQHIKRVIKYSAIIKLKKSSECKQYKAKLSRYNKKVSTINNNNKKAKEKANNFINLKSHIKPPTPDIEIIEFSHNNFYSLLNSSLSDALSPSNQIAIDETEPQEKTLSKRIKEKLTGLNSFQVISYPAWLLCFLLLLPVFIIGIKKRQWSLLIFALAVPTYNYILYASTLISQLSFLGVFQLTSPIFAQIAFVWFLLYGKIRSRAFAVFIGLLFASIFLPLVLQSVFSLNSEGTLFNRYSVFKASLTIIIFVLIAGIGRLIIKGASENWALIKKLGYLQCLKHSARSFILWLPLAILCLPFFYLTESLIPKTTISTLHKHDVLHFDSSHQKGFLDNALQSTAHKIDDLNFVWHLTVEENKARLITQNNNVQKLNFGAAVNKHFNNIVPKEFEFDEPNADAGIFSWVANIATKETQKAINRSYTNMRGDINDKLVILAKEKEAELKATSDNKTDDISNQLELVKQEGKEEIAKFNKSTQSTLWLTINYIQALHQLALLLFGYICVKSFMYVFARVSFHQDRGTDITLGNHISGDSVSDSVGNHFGDNTLSTLLPSESTILAKGLDYVIKGDKEGVYYISRRYQCRGKPPKFSIPQVFRAPIARLFSKAYTMNKVHIKHGDPDVNCSATKGIEFFEWSLAKGETVVFEFKYFVGMSESISLSTLISPRISSLLLGGMIYSQATGPGKLILMTEGRAEIANGTIESGCFPPERVVAMDVNSQLHVDSELDPINIYLSTAHVKPVSGKMIIDVDTQKGAKTGLAHFIRNFLFPG